MQFLPNIKFLCLGEKHRDIPNGEIEDLVKKIENKYNTKNYDFHFMESFASDFKFRNGFNLYITRQSPSDILSKLTDRDRYIIFLLEDNYHLESSCDTPFIQMTSIDKNAMATVTISGFNIKCERILLNFLNIKCNLFRIETNDVTIHNCIIDGDSGGKTHGSIKMEQCQRVWIKKNHLKNIQIETYALSFGKIKQNLISNCCFKIDRSISSIESNVMTNDCNLRFFNCTFINIYNNTILISNDKLFYFDYSTRGNFSDNIVIKEAASSGTYRPFMGLDRSSKIKVLHNVFYGIRHIAKLDWGCSLKLHQNLFNNQIVEVSSYDSKCIFYKSNKYCSFELREMSFNYETGKYNRPNEEMHFVHEYPVRQTFEKPAVIENLDTIDKFLAEKEFDLGKIDGDKIVEISKQMKSLEKEKREGSEEYQSLLRGWKELIKNKIIEYSLAKNSLVCVLTTRDIIIPDRTVVSYF